jgi:membrane-associated phospholipid phosphatase
MRYFLFVTILFFSFSPPLHAQNGNYETRGYGKTIMCDVNDFFQTGVDLIARPFMWQGEDWLRFGGTFAATGALFLLDETVRDFAQKNQSDFNDGLFGIDDWITGSRALIAPSAVYLYGFFARNRKVRTLGLHAAEALIYSAAITQILKISFGRFRPYNDKGNLKFEAFSFSEDKYSLPSGHATAAFALAGVFSEAFDNSVWSVFCYGAASVISVARIYHDEHWLSDVFLGGVIGYSVAKFVVNNRMQYFQFGSVEITPRVFANGVGISAKF